MRRATPSKIKSSSITVYFYPRSPCGERHSTKCCGHRSNYFYPRSPCGERLSACSRGYLLRCNFYPRSPCGERRHVNASNFHLFGISIHALLAESDKCRAIWNNRSGISIHALLAESDPHIRSTSGGHPDISIHALLAESDVYHIL